MILFCKKIFMLFFFLIIAFFNQLYGDYNLIMMLSTCQRLIVFKVLRKSDLIKEIGTNSLNWLD